MTNLPPEEMTARAVAVGAGRAFPPDLVARIQNDFAFHPAAPGGDAAAKHDRVRFLLRTVAIALVDNTVPVGREQSLMLTALEEAMHWANAGIAKQGPVAT